MKQEVRYIKDYPLLNSVDSYEELVVACTLYGLDYLEVDKYDLELIKTLHNEFEFLGYMLQYVFKTNNFKDGFYK